jgi:zinc D-Ala-D-Ala carboxypeptidase
MKDISNHITYDEATVSQTATRKGIKNIPNAQELARMKNVATKIFDKVRDHFDVPIKVSSFFRSKELNAAVGGSKTSQHMTGEAIDMQALGKITNAQIYNYIKDNCEFDQLIIEGVSKNYIAWIHVSLRLVGKNRKQILIMHNVNGRTTYTPYTEKAMKEIFG